MSISREAYYKMQYLKKLNCTYEDKYEFIKSYYIEWGTNQDDIIEDNDEIVKEELDQSESLNRVAEFENFLALCSSMIDLNLYDEFVFEELMRIKEYYLKGEFDDYFFDKEKDKKDIDRDLKKVQDFLSTK